MSIYLEKFPGKAQEMLRYMHNVRLAANRVGHNGWSKYDQQYRLKKERNPSMSWGVVDYELWIMFVNTPSGPAQSSSVTSYQGNLSGVNSSFRSNSGAKTSTCSREAWSGTKPEQPTALLHQGLLHFQPL